MVVVRLAGLAVVFRWWLSDRQLARGGWLSMLMGCGGGVLIYSGCDEGS